MKILIYIVLLLIFSPHAMGQEWRDSLRAARQSYAQHNYPKSYRQYRSAQQAAPESIDLSDEVGQSAYKAGKYAEAEKIYAQSSSARGSSTQKARVHRQIGNARMQQKKYGEAIESYKESLRNNPNDDQSRYNLAEAMRKQKQQKEQQEKDQEQNQSKDQDQQQEDQQSQNSQKDPKQQQGQSKDNPQNSESGNEKPDQQNQNSQQQSPGSRQPQLSDKKSERMLDDLMKKEMETKKKFEGTRSSQGSTKKSKKDW